MTRFHPFSWSAIGLVLVLACSSSKSGIDGESTGSGSTGSGSNGSGSTGSGSSGSKTSGMGSTGTIPMGNAGVGSNGSGSTGSGSTGSGSTGSGSAANNGGAASGTGTNATGSVSGTVGGAGSTPTTDTSAQGGAGTSDPPPANGGTGQTEDPPMGGKGNTEDPPMGGKGNTDDPPPGDTIDPPPGDTIDPPPGDTIDPPPGCTMTEIDKVNVIVFKDATPAGADVEGKMWVGGKATFSGYGIGANDLGAATTACSEYTLVVGGDLSGSVNAGKGKVAVYGTNAANVSWTTVPGCGVFKNTKPVDFVALEAKLKGYSAAFKAYPSNGVGVISGGALVLTGTDPKLNVFNITAAELNNNIKLVVPVASSVVVNVSGTTVTWQGIGFQMPDGASCRGGTSDWCHRILWNLYEATSLTLGGIGVQGSVMAPYAKVSGNGGNVDGQLVCDSLIGGIEYHPYFFTGCLILPKV